MATLADTYDWDTDETSLKAHLGVSSTAEDDQIQRWYETAIAIGDQVLQNDFTDSDDADITHPAAIRLGLYEYVRAARAHHIAAKGQRVEGGYVPGQDEGSVGLRAAWIHWQSYVDGSAPLGWMVLP